MQWGAFPFPDPLPASKSIHHDQDMQGISPDGLAHFYDVLSG
jgi:hypothetical protein